MMNVGEAAKRCRLPVKTIRYYEEIGLVVPRRQENGYRAYDEAGVHKLRFLQRARGLGFSIDDCRSLLSLYEDTSRASADVKAIAQARLADIRRKIEELETLHATLSDVVDACHGDHRPHCPILEDLAGRPSEAIR
jgi:Cu(I)-responsive transcriptional regulator